MGGDGEEEIDKERGWKDDGKRKERERGGRRERR